MYPTDTNFKEALQRNNIADLNLVTPTRISKTYRIWLGKNTYKNLVVNRLHVYSLKRIDFLLDKFALVNIIVVKAHCRRQVILFRKNVDLHIPFDIDEYNARIQYIKYCQFPPNCVTKIRLYTSQISTYVHEHITDLVLIDDGWDSSEVPSILQNSFESVTLKWLSPIPSTIISVLMNITDGPRLVIKADYSYYYIKTQSRV